MRRTAALLLVLSVVVSLALPAAASESDDHRRMRLRASIVEVLAVEGLTADVDAVIEAAFGALPSPSDAGATLTPSVGSQAGSRPASSTGAIPADVEVPEVPGSQPSMPLGGGLTTVRSGPPIMEDRDRRADLAPGWEAPASTTESDDEPATPQLSPEEYDRLVSGLLTAEVNSGAAPQGSLFTSFGGGLFCPVAGEVSFIDSWGYARSGGRSHKGQDLFADHGTPLVALTRVKVGRVDPVDNYRVGSARGDLGGITVWLVDEAGDAWYYAHMSGIAPGVTPGVTLEAGQLVGWVGNTGNAATTPPHLHIGWYPGGGAAQNPYQQLRQACGG